MPCAGEISVAGARWSERVRARAYEIGSGWRVGPWTVCNWLQEAAGNQARALGWSVDELQRRGLTWVLSRLSVRFERLPEWREEVTVATWPSGVQRLFALREFTVSGDDGGRLAAATSRWLLVDVATRRPRRPPEEIAVMGRSDLGLAVEFELDRLPELSGPSLDRDFTVKVSDLDVNGHANNVAIITWMLDSRPDATEAAVSLREIDVEFRAEALAGDVVRSSVASAGDGAFVHCVRRLRDGREVARGRSRCCGGSRATADGG